MNGGQLLAWLEVSLPFVVRALVAGAAGALVGMLLCIPLLVLIRRRRWLKRGPRAWDLATLLVYPYLIVCFMGAGVAFGVIREGHQQSRALVQGTLSPLARSNLPAMKQWLTERVDWSGARDFSLDEATHRVLSTLYIPPASDAWFDRHKARALNYLTLNLGKWMVTAGLGVVMAYGAGRAGDSLGLSEETVRFSVDVIRRMDLSRVDDNFFQILERAVLDHVAAAFGGLYLQVALTLGLLLLIPVVEALLYFHWFERRPKVKAVMG